MKTRNAVVAALALLAWALPPPALAGAKADLERLASWMAGSFGSAAQAARDADYRDIRLRVTPIWRERVDGPWLYVEQAAATSLEKPYRQRVYQLVSAGKKTIESRVYVLPTPERFAGAWKENTPLAALVPEDLTLKAGCEVVLERKGKDAFAGSTRGTSCPSELRGAAYATSEVTITARGMTSWDRGFDASGKQTWGAEKGPYEFLRAD